MWQGIGSIYSNNKILGTHWEKLCLTFHNQYLYGLNVLLNFMSWSLITSVRIQIWAFWKGWSCEGRFLIDGARALWRAWGGAEPVYSTFDPSRGCHILDTVFEAETGSHLTPNLLRPWSWNFVCSPELWENKLFINYPVLGILLQQYTT